MSRLLSYIDASAFDVIDHPVADGDGDFPIRSALVRAPLSRLVKSRGMPWYGLSDLRAEWRAYQRVGADRCDVIHYLDPEHSAQYLPLRLARAARPRAGTIATFHQPPDELDRLVRRKVVETLGHAVLVSPEQEPFFDGLLAPECVSVVPHGVDVDFFRPGTTTATSDRGTFECLSVGHYLRDFDAVREVAARLADDSHIRFRVIASQPTGLDGLGNVTVESGLGDVDLLEAYQRADVLFLPLVACTANNALLEGVACGLPVVSSDHASTRFYLPGEEAVLIRDNDPDHFAHTLLELRDQPERRARMAATARLRAEELGWPRIAPRYEALYMGTAPGGDG